MSRASAYNERRLGRILLSEAFVVGDRSNDIFEDFVVLLAQPRYNDDGIIAYYGAHPGFEPFDGAPKDSPYYHPYWNEEGVYFKQVFEHNGTKVSFEDWLVQLDRLFVAKFGLTHNDFEDYDWHGEFDGENTPVEAFEEWQLIQEGATLGG